MARWDWLLACSRKGSARTRSRTQKCRDSRQSSDKTPHSCSNYRFFPPFYKALLWQPNNLDTTTKVGKGEKTVSHFSCSKYLIQELRQPRVAAYFLHHAMAWREENAFVRKKKLSIFLFNLNKLAIQRETRSSLSPSPLHSTRFFWTPLSTLDSCERYINHFWARLDGFVSYELFTLLCVGSFCAFSTFFARAIDSANGSWRKESKWIERLEVFFLSSLGRLTETLKAGNGFEWKRISVKARRRVDTVKEESTIKNGGKKTRRECRKQEFLCLLMPCFARFFLFLLLYDLQRKVRKWVTRRTEARSG